MVKAMGSQVIIRRAGGLSQVISGIFDYQTIEQFDAVVRQPVLTVAENEIAIAVGDTVEIDQTLFSIRESFPDGDGFVTYTLRRE